MRVDRYPDPTAFWRDAREFLERDEAGNTQVLAIASRHAAEPGDKPPACFAVCDGETPLAAAMLTAKGTLFLTPAPVAALQALHAEIGQGESAITDIVAVRAAAESYAQLAGIPCRIRVCLRLYRLDAVTPVPEVAGSMRQAGAGDFDLLCAWQRVFFEDAHMIEAVDEIPQIVERRLRTGGGWLWEVDGVPVAHAGYRDTPIRSARIAPVYTPRALRGRGYASGLCAALCRHLLAQGRSPLYLFADADNPTANGVYQRIGFRHIGDQLHLTRRDDAA